MSLFDFKMNSLWRPAKGIFKKPKLEFYFGLWRSDPCLPCYRIGPRIEFGKFFEWEETRVEKILDSTYTIGDNIYYKKKYKTKYKWTEAGKRNHPILSKILPAVIQFPIWLKFAKYSYDVMWKTKYDDYRYEHPGSFTLVFFGLSFSIWNNAPVKTSFFPASKVSYDNDAYWESILWFTEFKEKGYSDLEALKLTNDHVGYKISNYGKEDEYYSYNLHPDYLENSKLRLEFMEWQTAQAFNFSKNKDENEFI